MSNNEHTAASLGHSEVLSVKHPVGPPVPEVSQRPEDGSHVPSSVRRQKSGDVLDDHPRGTEFINETSELVEQSAPDSSQPSTASSHAEVLAGESSAENIDSWELGSSKRLDVAVEVRVRPPSLEHPLGVAVDLALPEHAHSRSLEAEIKASDAAEQGSDGEHT